ncbi:MAG: hypothetical protein ACYC9M_14420, partial [Desulfobulbaceae bacterium]
HGGLHADRNDPQNNQKTVSKQSEKTVSNNVRGNISSPSRVLVMLEQFAGVAYLAVVVSRLIGLTIVRHHDKGTS